jgi:hypothetical protein
MIMTEEEAYAAAIKQAQASPYYREALAYAKAAYPMPSYDIERDIALFAYLAGRDARSSL